MFVASAYCPRSSYPKDQRKRPEKKAIAILISFSSNEEGEKPSADKRKGEANEDQKRSEQALEALPTYYAWLGLLCPYHPRVAQRDFVAEQ